MHIAIIGLLGRRHREIQQKFPHVQFRFVETDHYKQLRRYQGKIVMMLRFVNHGIVEGVLRYHDRTNVSFIRTGMPELYSTLERIAVRPSAGAQLSAAVSAQ